MIRKGIGILILLSLTIIILLKVVIPAVSLALGFGVDIPETWARSPKLLFFYSHPWAILLLAIMAVTLLGWVAFRLIRS